MASSYLALKRPDPDASKRLSKAASCPSYCRARRRSARHGATLRGYTAVLYYYTESCGITSALWEPRPFHSNTASELGAYASRTSFISLPQLLLFVSTYKLASRLRSSATIE